MRVKIQLWVAVIAAMFISMVVVPIGSEGSEPEDAASPGVSFAGGTGTLNDPYQVTNVTQLQNISSDLNSHYILMNNISASITSTWNAGAGFDPIGTLGSEFNGTFDGSGNSISGLEINRPGKDGVGLFGYTGSGSMISNLILSGNISGRASVGALVGSSLSTLYNITTYCRVTGARDAIGGLVGFNEGDITSSTSGFYTIGNWYLGGLVGQNNGGMVLDCSSNGIVMKRTGSNIGGLIGRNIGMVMSSNSSCLVNGAGMNAVGGLIGYNNGPVDLCNSTGDVLGAQLVGGIVGTTLDRITNSFSEGNITGSGGQVGGIAGQSGDAFATSASVVTCRSTGNVNGGGWNVGGIVGRSYESILNSYNTGDVTGNGNRIGGIAGFCSKGVVDSFNTGSVSGGDEVGGIIGFMYTSAKIDRCYSTGFIRGMNFVGGLAGNSTSSACIIQESVSLGDVRGSADHVGGVVGWNHDQSATVRNCYSHGDVTGVNYVGGLAGSNAGQIDFCYSTGRVTGTATVGGLIGWNLGTQSDCFWDNRTSQILTSSGGSGRNTTDLMHKITFVNWDLGGVWNNVENRTYPFLRWIPSGEPTITSDNILFAVEEENYYQDYDAIDDPVSEIPLHWFLEEGPSWLMFNLYTGDLYGTPENIDVGSFWVNISVYDGTGGYNFTRFLLTVNNTNDPVILFSDPVEQATEEVAYSYMLGIFDEDLLNPSGEVIFYSLDESPDGMSIDPLLGNFTWLPTNEQAHQGHNVTLNVTDGDMFVTQSYSVWVFNTNDPVMINSEPVLNATQDHLYVYHVNATDDDLFNPSGEELYYSLDIAPEGMTIMEGTGIIRWVPTNKQVQRYHDVTLNVTDGDMFVLQEFQIYVENMNDPLVIDSDPITDAYEDVEYSYQIESWDIDFITPEGEVHTYSLHTSPEGMNIDNETGLITWVPTNEQAFQEHLVILNVTDGEYTETQQFKIAVHNENDAPQINSTPVVEATEHVHYSYLIDVWDEDLLNPSGEELNISLDVHPEGMMLGFPHNLVVWVPEIYQSGMYHEVVINVSDGEEYILQSYTIYVQRVTPEFFNISLGPVLFEDDSIAEGLNVTLRSDIAMEKISITNGSGYFSFNDISPGNYTVVIQGPAGNHTFILKISVYGILRYDLPDIALPVVVDDDDITDDDIVDDDTADDDDDPKDNTDLYVMITVAALLLLLIAGILLYLINRRGDPHSEE